MDSDTRIISRQVRNFYRYGEASFIAQDMEARMTPGLTLAYITSRREPRIEWFFDSLARQVVLPSRLIVVDYFADEPGRRDEVFEKYARAFTAPLHLEHEKKGNVPAKFFTHVAPKPTVWQGQYRLTREDWFAASNARNTALCYARDGYIAYADDVSVLMPGWWNSVVEAMGGNYIVCGAYKKVKNLTVENGVAVSYDEFGADDRLHRVSQDISPCEGGWLFGCSSAMSVKDLLDVGGWPEYCDGLGSEDYCLGIALHNAGKHLRYDRRMLTLESVELHYVETPMKRSDYGVSPSDKSHAALKIAKAATFFPNYFPEGGIGAVRESVLAGNPFPIIQEPRHEWFTGLPLEEL